jgi:molybdopterin/thiamine biosynthesis adenylyltransferase
MPPVTKKQTIKPSSFDETSVQPIEKESLKSAYEQSFKRNIGNVTHAEQRQLRETVVAIAGVGGVGGAALNNIARMGVGSVKIADPEEFAYSDINRQRGATTKTVGKKKVEVLSGQIRAINPDIKVEAYHDGLTEENANEFLEGASIVIEGLEFFCMPLKKKLFDHARELGIYILSSPIFGFGTSLAVFAPDGPTFEECFGAIPDKLDFKYAANFGRSFFPTFPRYINLAAYFEAMKENRPIPSFTTSCALSGAVTAAETLFILLGKRDPICFPYVRRFDLHEARIYVDDSRKRNPGPLKKLVLKVLFSIKKPKNISKEIFDLLLD